MIVPPTFLLIYQKTTGRTNSPAYCTENRSYDVLKMPLIQGLPSKYLDGRPSRNRNVIGESRCKLGQGSKSEPGNKASQNPKPKSRLSLEGQFPGSRI